MDGILVGGIDIFLLSRHRDFDLVAVLAGLDNTKIGRDLVITFRTPRNIARYI